MPVIPALRRLRQKDHKFKAKPGCRKDNPEKRKGWRCSSVMDCFLSMCKTLGWIPRTGKRIKNKDSIALVAWPLRASESMTPS
jgi:hypothetical protein